MINIPKTELINVTELKTDDKNPNVMSKKGFESLKKVMKKYGFIVPIITNNELIVADGHHRLKAAQELKIEHVPVIKLDVSEVDRRLLRQIMNKLKGTHDIDLDFEEFKFLFEENMKDDLLDLLPDQSNEINKILKKIEEGNIHEEEEFVEVTAYERAKTKTKIKPGDIFQLGNHRLMCGDSTKEADVNKLMDGKTMNLMVTDPPYGVNYDPKWRDEVDKKGILQNKYPIRATGDVKNDNQVDWTEAYKLFNGKILYIWHAGKYTAEVKEDIESIGFEIISQIIWAKPHFALSRGDYHWQHEPCWYAIKKGENHNWQGSRNKTTLWKIAGMNAMGGSHDKADERTGHGTQKPIECMQKPIMNNTQIGENIYDPFGGSGTTLIAAEQTDRNCYMMELDPVYVFVIIERWEKFTNKKAVKVN